MSEDRILGWDDEISNDGGSLDVLPPGVYPFEIVDLKKGNHQPGTNGKLPPCPKATVKLRCPAPDGLSAVDVTHNLFMHSRCEGMLCAFFLGIGQRKHGEPLRPNWNRVVGSRGWVKLGVRDYVSNDGEKRQTNEVKAFVDPDKVKGQPQNPPSTPPGADGF